MTSLTQVAIVSRKIIRYSIYLVIFIIIGRITINIATKIYRHYFPEPPPPPTVSFGKLPAIPFPDSKFPENISFNLQTPDGKLPKFPKQLTVYFMPKAVSTIKSLDAAKQEAISLGFNPNGRELVETVYLFPHGSSPASLNLNIVTGIFSISYDLNSKPSVIQNIPPTPEAATALAKSFLSRARSLPDDISGPVTSEYIKILEGRFVPALSLSDANFIKVNLFRKNYNDLPAVAEKFNQANIWFMFSGAREGGDQIIAAEYHYFPLDENNNGTYPIKTPDDAWQDLKSGKAYLVNFGENEAGSIAIRKVYLAYYDAGQYTQFYQPVAVFEGDNNFKAYVPVISSDYYSQNEAAVPSNRP
jgi:hypothetical protein